MSDHIIFGNKGEELALKFLKKLKYTILQTNWRYKKDEIDIIGIDKDMLVFVEVKTRKSDIFCRPEQTITNKKRGAL